MEDTRKNIPDLFYNILKDKPKHRIYSDCLGLGKLNVNGEYVSEERLVLRMGDDNNDIRMESFFDPDFHNKYSSIQIFDFTLKSLVKYVDHIANGRKNEEYKYYNKYYNKYYLLGKTIKNYGINFNEEVKFGVNTITYLDVKTLLEDMVTSRAVSSTISEFFYLGKKHTLAGFVTTTGKLVLRKKVLEKLLEKSDFDKVVEIYSNMLTVYSKINNKIVNASIKHFKDEIVESESKKAIDLYFDEVLDNNIVDVDKERSDEIIENIKSIVEQRVDLLLSDSIFGTNSNYSYISLINDVFTQHKDSNTKIYKEGFSKGMQLGMKFELVGWNLIEPNFPDHTNSRGDDIWWYKEVNIVPDTFCYDGERYLIPENERIYNVSKIYINQKGEMRCEGKHPNVEGTKVCMGDLQINWMSSIDDIGECLYGAETLLDMINYDSAYDTSKVEHMKRVSTKVESISDIGRSKTYDRDDINQIRSGDSIFEDDFEEDEDDDEVEDVITEEIESDNATDVTEKEIVRSLDALNDSNIAELRPNNINSEEQFENAEDIFDDDDLEDDDDEVDVSLVTSDGTTEAISSIEQTHTREQIELTPEPENSNAG